MAEVLITLGVIGVVAAVTMPTLVANHKKQTTVTQLKKAYSEISQAIKMSQVQNGEISLWDFTLSGADFYDVYLKDYFVKNREISNAEFKSQYSSKITNLNNSQCTEVWCNQDDSFYVYLNDGFIMGIMSHPSQTKYKSITVDINGLKGLNKLGKDFFVFSMIAPDGLVPYGFKTGGVQSQSFETIDRDTLISTQQYACNKNSKGIWCAALIMIDGWQIKDDYPW